jgi:hypothetical protein
VLFLHAGSLKRVQENHHPNLGRMLQPRDFSRLTDTLAAGYPVGVDNDGYRGVDFERFSKMLCCIRDELFGELPTTGGLVCHAAGQWPAEGEPSPLGPPRSLPDTPPENFLWVVVPDVVADAAETYRWFQWLAPSMSDLPLAFVVQDGAGDVGLPWDAPNLRCLFLGGSDEYKLSTEMAQIAVAGKERGLWIHGGRCNSFRRVRHFAAIGCDSFDGTGASKWPSKVQEYLEWASAPAQQSLLV